MSGLWSEDTDLWREKLVVLGFSDDGERLCGPVPWQHQASGAVTAQAQIVPGETFPFAPPRVDILDLGAQLEFTFHIESDGALCLWENDWAVDQAPWRDPRKLLRRIAGWLENTASGWPGGEVCDLERYLSQDRDSLILYDAPALRPGHTVRTAPGPTSATTLVTADQRNVSDIFRAPRGRRPRSPGRKDRRLAWIADIGAVRRPLRTWEDVAAALGPTATELGRLISLGIVDLLLLRYSRGGSGSVLALKARSEQELAGYRDAQDYLFQQDWRPLNAGLLLHLHRLLFAHTAMPGGAFKTEDNLVPRQPTFALFGGTRQ